MAENLPNSISELNRGVVIQFADLTELVAFEDLVVADIKPDYDGDMWASRPHLRDFVRPERIGKHVFNGTIANITLTPIEDPYHALLTAKERGYKGRPFGLNAANEAKYASRYRGYELLAYAKSSGRGTIGQIQTELYYYPFPFLRELGKVKERQFRTKDGEVRNSVTVAHKDYRSQREIDYGQTIGRVIFKPKTPTENFIQLSEDSRRIGFEVLRHSMMNPFGGMR